MTSNLQEELQAAVGSTLALERELPGGGASHLFVATEPSLGRRVVLKVLVPDLSAAIDVARFRREIELTARLTHPNIVPVLAARESGRFRYYIMPYVEGESLHARLAREGALPIADAVSIFRDLAKALSHAHAHGVMHRDLKPENVLLVQGTAMLADFGIARALDAATAGGVERTASGIAVGTPMYVSPEQAAGDPRMDHRTDLYSLGIVAYEMLTGEPPFTHRALRMLLAAHQNQAPPPIMTRRPHVPSWLAQLVMRLLEKQPADRPQTADEVLRVLDGAVSNPLEAESPIALTTALRPAGNRRRGIVDRRNDRESQRSA